jgi:hypothetical protein
MKPLIDLTTWLLERDIRAKNAASVLLALLSAVCFYFITRHSQWMQEIDRRGTLAVPIALVVVFLISFLTVWLIAAGILRQYERTIRRRQLQELADQKRISVRRTLESLTDWQRRFLLRFIVEGRTQIPEFEVGQFRAAWDFQMDVLVQKGVVRQHRRAGVYEIEPVYLEYLQENWDPQNGTLR